LGSSARTRSSFRNCASSGYLVMGIPAYFRDSRYTAFNRPCVVRCMDHSTIRYASIQKMLDEIAAPGKIFPSINFTFAVCGVLGGLVGSTILTFALSLLCKEFGRFENWARIVMPGTALGVLLELAARDDKLPVHIGSMLPLFLAWQVTVAAIIGYCIVPRSGDGKPAPH
jgi:hypothetical protein